MARAIGLLAERRVVGVLVLASISAPRAFTADELAVAQKLATEAALTLERLRTTSDLGAAIERERIVGAIATRLRPPKGSRSTSSAS